jgi:hypothetical protein
MTVQRFVQLFTGYQTIETMSFLRQLTVDAPVIEILKHNLPTEKPLLEDYF